MLDVCTNTTTRSIFTACLRATVVVLVAAPSLAQDAPLIGRVSVRPATRTAVINIQTTRISVATDGTQANGASRDPSITADGRYVVFTSDATNLAHGAAAGHGNVFLRDLQANQTTLLASASYAPRITPDGRYVSYRREDDDGTLLVLDRLIGVTTRLASAYSISDDFRLVAMNISGSLLERNLLILDRDTGRTLSLGIGDFPVLSGDGSFVVYYRYSGLDRSTNWVTDLSTGRTEGINASGFPRSIRANRYLLFDDAGVATPWVLVDRLTGRSYGSLSFAVSDNGRYATYVDGASARHDLYKFDIQTNTLLRVSAPASGVAADGDTFDSAVDNSGRVVYTSNASNLVSGDTNGLADVFLSVGGVDPAIPTEPLALVPTVTVSGSTATVVLSWLPPKTGGAPSTYIVEAGSAAGSIDLANFSNGPGTSVRGTVPLGRTIFVRVRAANDAGVSPPSAELSFTPGRGVSPAAPTQLGIAGGTLMWIAPASGDRPITYQVQIGSVRGTSDVAVIQTNSSDTLLDAAPVGAYVQRFVRVVAINATSASPPSNELEVLRFPCGTITAPQGIPTSLTATASQGTVTLSFGPVTSYPYARVGSYVVQQGTASGVWDVATFDAGLSIPIVLRNVPSGRYVMRVRASNGCGLGSPSNEVTVTVP